MTALRRRDGAGRGAARPLALLCSRACECVYRVGGGGVRRFNAAETTSTIRFGASAKTIKNKPRVNVSKSVKVRKGGGPRQPHVCVGADVCGVGGGAGAGV